MKSKLLICICILTLLLAGCGSLNTEDSHLTSEEEQSATEQVENAQLTFSAVDFQGNTITQEIFAESRLTVVNVWASYCSPCVREMPDLEELSKEYDVSEVQVIGIASDATDDKFKGYAESVIENTGVEFLNLLPSEDLYDCGFTDVQYVPTTFFVNSEGEVIDRVVGSKSKEEWKKMIDDKLASL